MLYALYLLCLVVTGYAVALPALRVHSRLELLGYALTLGPGAFSLCLIFLSMCGVRPTFAVVMNLAAVMAVIALTAWRWQLPSISAAPQPMSTFAKRWTALCLVAIAFGLVLVGVDALIYPTIEWDAFAIWQLKAKVLAVYALWPRPDYFSDVSLSFSHLRYPILVPMMSAGVHAISGNVADEMGKIPSLLLFAGMGLMIYTGIRNLCGHIPAITACALLMTLPTMLDYAGSGTAELAVTAFYAGSLASFLRWQQKQLWGDLILAAIFTVFMAWSKNEGAALAAVNVVMVPFLVRPIRRRHWIAAMIFLEIVLLLYLPWPIYTRGLPRTDEDYPGHLNLHTMITNLPRVLPIIKGMVMAAVNIQDWGGFWILPLVLGVLYRRQSRSHTASTIWTLLVLQILAYCVAFLVVANWKLSELMGVSAHRLLLHATPAVAILIGLYWPAQSRNQTRVAVRPSLLPASDAAKLGDSAATV